MQNRSEPTSLGVGFGRLWSRNSQVVWQNRPAKRVDSSLLNVNLHTKVIYVFYVSLMYISNKQYIVENKMKITKGFYRKYTEIKQIKSPLSHALNIIKRIYYNFFSTAILPPVYIYLTFKKF